MKHTITILLITILLLLPFTKTYSQNDSTDVAFVTGVDNDVDTAGLKKHSPKLASYLSMALPGAGQVYNRQYWKPPIIYTGFGLLIAGYRFNNYYYKRFKDAHHALSIYNPGNGIYIEDQWFPDVAALQTGRDQYRKSRDMMAIGMGLLYILNIIDASVSGHFYDYDISEDLSIRFEPALINTVAEENTIGLKLNVYF